MSYYFLALYQDEKLAGHYFGVRLGVGVYVPFSGLSMVMNVRKCIFKRTGFCIHGCLNQQDVSFLFNEVCQYRACNKNFA